MQAIAKAPANTTAPTQTTFTPEIRAATVPNFNVLTDVSNSLVAEYDRSRFNSDTKLLYADISIKNIARLDLLPKLKINSLRLCAFA